MSSLVTVNTYAHSVTYVTDQMLRSLRLIIQLIGLDQIKFLNSWESNERAIRTWLQSGHLKAVILEIYHPRYGLVTRCDLKIDYGYGGGQGAMWVDTDAIRYAIAKFGTIPIICEYKVILTVAPGEPYVSGWGDGKLFSTAGFTRQSLGTTIGTNSIGTEAAYWRKTT